MKRRLNPLWRWFLMLVLTWLCLQIYFFASVLMLRWSQPPSTSFQRGAIISNLLETGHLPKTWSHQSVSHQAISNHVRRAVVASEDDLFFEHFGVDWQAIQNAAKRNAHSKALRGGSTITQQLAKNLFLSGERSMVRKVQELLITWFLELSLPKNRILDIYLNQVEWGENIYGIQAAAKYYFRTNASSLSPEQAARLASMLPNPEILGSHPYSAYMQRRTQIITRRQFSVTLPPN